MNKIDKNMKELEKFCKVWKIWKAWIRNSSFARDLGLNLLFQSCQVTFNRYENHESFHASVDIPCTNIQNWIECRFSRLLRFILSRLKFSWNNQHLDCHAYIQVSRRVSMHSPFVHVKGSFGNLCILYEVRKLAVL